MVRSHQTGGPEALDDRSPRPDRVWNRIPDDVRARIVGGTLGYRWTYPHTTNEVTAPAQQARVPPPTTSPRSLSTRPAPDKAAPEQHVLQIVSHRSEADVLAVFRILQKSIQHCLVRRLSSPFRLKGFNAHGQHVLIVGCRVTPRK